MSERVGFIGLGAMGEGMTRQLIANGFSVSVFDVDSSLVERLVGAGAVAADSPRAAAAHASVLMVCVFNAAQAEAVLFDEDGALGALGEGSVVAMHTTLSPDQSRQIAQRLASDGIGYVDAPVTGGKQGADEGTLTVIASGDDASMQATEGVFAAMGSRISRVGDVPGAASSVKMINQMLVGVHVAAAAEAIAFAVKSGADPHAVYDVITHGAGNSVAFETRVPRILERDHTPRGVIDIFTKDLGIVMDTARALSFPLPLTSTAMQQYLAAAQLGLGRSDDSCLIRVYEMLGRVDVAGGTDSRG
jgi:3-hydroxyisobutyrate dehydrogenase